MKKFELERIHRNCINVDKFKFSIPVCIYKPKVIDESTVIFIYSTGLNGTIDSIDNFNYPIFDNNFLVSYEKSAIGSNKNKATLNKNNYVRELWEVVKWVKNKYSKYKIFLIGESWGTALAFLCYKKHPNEISGVIGWNMPCKLVDPSKKSIKEKIMVASKIVFTLLTNIDTYDKNSKELAPQLSSNPIIIRASQMNSEKNKSNNKITFASWRSFKPAWKFIEKNAKNKNFNFIYVQSGKDIMCDKKRWKKFYNNALNNHKKFIENGYHILSFEEPWNKELFEQFNKIKELK